MTIKQKLKLATMIILMSALIMPSLSSAALVEFYSATGKIFTSVDGAGSDNAAGHSIDVTKPSTGATVRKAFLMESSNNVVINDGDVQLNGEPVKWSFCTAPIIPQENLISCRADVTALVKPMLDAAPAGVKSFSITETETIRFNIDGEVLVVVFDNPTETKEQTVILMHGAQSPDGDSFEIAFSEPIDQSDSSAVADMGLGIGFSRQTANLQGSKQFKVIDVNGKQLTSSAGGNNDGGIHGGLITVGGIGDSNSNPDLLQQAKGNTRLDDELYTILPFLGSEDTSLKVSMKNPSDDDLMFFAYFKLSAIAGTGESILLSPATSTRPVRTKHTVSARMVDPDSSTIINRAVDFNILSGPNRGTTGSGTTDAQGNAVFMYTDTQGPGIDKIQASIPAPDSVGNPEVSNIVEQVWRGSSGIVLAPDTAINPVKTEHTVTALLVDSTGSTVKTAGRGFGFNIIAGPNNGKTGTGTTDDQGKAVFTYTDTKGPGTDTILASTTNSAGDPVLSNPVKNKWRDEEIVLSPETANNLAGTNDTVTATVVDGNSNLIPQRDVTFRVIAGPNDGKTGTGTTDTPQGEATFTYTDTEGPGTDQIQASFLNTAGQPVESKIVEKIWFAKGLFLFPETVTIRASTTHTVTAILSDDNGIPIPNRAVSFTVTAGPNNGKFGTSTTNDQGEAFFTYTDMAGPGTDQIQASIVNPTGTTDLSNSIEIIWRGSDGIVLSPITATSDIGIDHTVTALIIDNNDNPIAGRNVSFAAISGPNNGKTGSGTTDAQGEAMFTYTDTAGPGTDQILASFSDFSGEVVVSTMVEKIWGSTPPLTPELNIGLSPVTATSPIGTEHTVTAVLKDGDNNIEGSEIRFDVITGPNTGKTGTGTSDVQGEVVFTYADMAGPGTDQIQASFLDSASNQLKSNIVEKIWQLVPSSIKCDVNGDSVIDRNDIRTIFLTRHSDSSGSDDPRDADRDGKITVNDARACAVLCTLPNCERS